MRELFHVRKVALDIATDTFLLHDYFLFYSPLLLAASAVWLSLDITLRKIKKNQQSMAQDQTELGEALKALLEREQEGLCRKFNTELIMDGKGEIDLEDITMIAEDIHYRKEQ